MNTLPVLVAALCMYALAYHSATLPGCPEI